MKSAQIDVVARTPALDHEFARAHLPWAVNATLDELAQRRVLEHAAQCAECGAALAQQRRLAAALQGAPVVELAPQAGLAKLMSRIDVREARRERLARLLRPLQRLAGERAHRPLVLIAASQAVVILLLTVVLLALSARPPTPAAYRTLGNAPQGAPARVQQLRVVFDAQLTLAQIGSLLEPLHARIVDGPRFSKAGGIVTLAVEGDSEAALRTLRAQAGVRFAELVWN